MIRGYGSTTVMVRLTERCVFFASLYWTAAWLGWLSATTMGFNGTLFLTVPLVYVLISLTCRTFRRL